MDWHPSRGFARRSSSQRKRSNIKTNTMIKALHPFAQPSSARGATHLLVSLLFTAVVSSAAAKDVYSTAFERPAFTAGSTLAGQDGWIAPPPLSPNAAIITTGKP